MRRIFLTANTSFAALTKTETMQALEWTKLGSVAGPNGIKETGSINISDSYDTTLHIDVCLADISAHEGTEVIVQIASEAGVDDGWTTLVAPLAAVALVGANYTNFTGDEAAGQTILSIENPDTEHFNHDGKFVFIEHTTTPASCEIAYQIDNSGDAGDTITVLNGITHSQTAADTNIWTIDGDGKSAVWQMLVKVPVSASQARVIFNNYYDNDGTAADVYVRCRVTKVTAL